jgi:hypothetical protein
MLIGRSDSDSTSASDVDWDGAKSHSRDRAPPAYELTIPKGGLKINFRESWPKIIQQLELKLEPGREPAEVLVVDRLEKPREN